MKKKIGKRMAPLKSSLEECELSSANSDEQVAHGSNERPSYRYFILRLSFGLWRTNESFLFSRWVKKFG